jgi:membrane peptidoglycan carboxypeptidase
MLLARRIESVLTKQQILELYLNEIPLGRQSFGVQAAARAYFDKDVGDLSLHEAAFLAILPKAPENYSRAAMPTRRWPVATGCSTRCRRMASSRAMSPRPRPSRSASSRGARKTTRRMRAISLRKCAAS